MESTNKLAMVPHQVLTKLMRQQQSNKEPQSQQLNVLEEASKQILNQTGNDPETEYKQYQQLAHRQRALKQKVNEPLQLYVHDITTTKDSTKLPLPENIILGDLPKNVFRSKTHEVIPFFPTSDAN